MSFSSRAPPAILFSPVIDKDKDTESSEDDDFEYDSPTISLKSPLKEELEQDDDPEGIVHSPLTSPQRPQLRRLGRLAKKLFRRKPLIQFYQRTL